MNARVRENHEKVTSEHNTKLFSWLQKYSSVDQYFIRRRGEKERREADDKGILLTESERKSSKKKIRVKHQREREKVVEIIESTWLTHLTLSRFKSFVQMIKKEKYMYWKVSNLPIKPAADSSESDWICEQQTS